jgi:hypothetical protein
MKIGFQFLVAGSLNLAFTFTETMNASLLWNFVTMEIDAKNCELKINPLNLYMHFEIERFLK